MFLLGVWRNYDDLEECLTVGELTATYNSILEKENDRMMFEAKIAGADITGKDKQDSLKEHMDNHEAAERERKALAGEQTQFAAGLGYRVLGG